MRSGFLDNDAASGLTKFLISLQEVGVTAEQ